MLVLSIFTGVGLLDKAFRENGFCVVSAGDIIYGQDIREFKALTGKFDGVIGGSPCQDFSGLKRNKTNYSKEMLSEYIRVVKEASPEWFLLENVANVPTIDIDGYYQQRLDINQGWYSNTSRLRHIQFGSKCGKLLNIPRGSMNGVNRSCALASDNRSLSELLDIQGLPSDFDLPDFNVAGKKKMIGNGVPLDIGRVLASEVLRLFNPGGSRQSVSDQTQFNVTKPGKEIVTHRVKKSCAQSQIKSDVETQLCGCNCGRKLVGRKKYYDSSCRKRAQRMRDNVAAKSRLIA